MNAQPYSTRKRPPRKKAEPCCHTNTGTADETWNKPTVRTEYAGIRAKIISIGLRVVCFRRLVRCEKMRNFVVPHLIVASPLKEEGKRPLGTDGHGDTGDE
eukprot:8607120-Pyramimonas_sp.AAC.1